MSAAQIIFLTGAHAPTLAELGRELLKAGCPAGYPRQELSGPFSCRHEPEHNKLWYWQAIRRYFDDFGLPPIAAVPEARLTPEALTFYGRALANAIVRSAPDGDFIFVDQLTALVFPLVNKAVNLLGLRSRAFFLYRHPAKDIYAMQKNEGQPAQLTEFIWRNLVTSVVLEGGQEVELVDLDSLDPFSWQNFLQDISGNRFHKDMMPLLPAPRPLPQGISLSPLTLDLYNALKACSGGSGWQDLLVAAQEAYSRQAEQNGWQFCDSIDSGELNASAKRMLIQAGDPTSAAGAAPLDSGEDLLQLLEDSERRLMEARQEYETRLFLQSQALAAHYRHALQDEKGLREFEPVRLTREKPRSERIRKTRKLQKKSHADTKIYR